MVESAAILAFIESAFIVESAVAFIAAESTAGAAGAIVAVESVLVESVVEAAPEPPPQAAKTPRPNTNTSFFMFCECLMYEFEYSYPNAKKVTWENRNFFNYFFFALLWVTFIVALVLKTYYW